MQIKIRVWDKDSETMIYGVGITPESDGGIPYQIPVNAHDFDQFDYYPNSIIMLYTGLKDENGTEIYEGDILEITELSGRIGGYKVGRYTVNFDAGAYVAGDLYVGGGYKLGLVARRAKVIGNIYEHPHLLGGEEE